MKKKILLACLVSGFALTALHTGAAGRASAAKATWPDEKNSSPNTETEASLIQTAEAFAADLLAGDYEALKTNYTYDLMMKPVVAGGTLEQSFAPFLASAGALMEQKPAFVSAVQGGYTNIDVPCLHQLQPWNLTLTFTSDGTIGGVHISAYSTGLPSIPDGITETELPLPIANGRTLPGYLTMPDNAENCDAVVLVHGSGSSDHDETIGQIRPFQDLAWGLAQKGFAVYRYDKISAVYGEELANDPTFTVYDETVNDATAAIELLRSQPGIRSVSVLGHSQGGMMMGAIAASGSPDSCILMAAPAESFADTLLDQLDFLEEHGHTVSSDAALYDALKELADTLKDIDSLSDDATVMGLYPAYLRSLADYDAVKEAKKIQVPVLVLQGEEDYQVPMKNFRLWQEECKDFANWNFASFPNLTHLFTEGSYENGPADYSGEKHIPQEVIDRIADFLSDTFCS